jgi:hypothetical protein
MTAKQYLTKAIEENDGIFNIYEYLTLLMKELDEQNPIP